MQNKQRGAHLKVAALFDNFGPYHLARLTAASAVMEILAVEFGGSSGEYAWERSEAAQALQRVTLFPASSSRQVSTLDFEARLNEVLDGFRPEAVAIPGWSGRGAFLAMEWCVKNRVPAIVMSESTSYDETRSGWREWIKRRYVGLCSAALVGGRPHREYMQQLGMAAEQIFLGYDAVDNRYFAEQAEKIRNQKSEIRNHRQLPDNYFLASARFIEKKNLSRLIEAYALYRKHSAVRNPQSAIWSLVLLGDGELRPTLNARLLALHEKEMGERSRQTRFSTSSLLESVHLPGFKQYPELPIYYALAGAFIHASTTEQWGLVVNEAMASGLPVLVSNRCGCAPDLVEESVNGFTFDPTNVEQLARLMFELSTKVSQLSTFGAASQRIISNWGMDRFAQGLKEAAECAIHFGSPRKSLLSCLVLWVLIKLK